MAAPIKNQLAPTRILPPTEIYKNKQTKNRQRQISFENAVLVNKITEIQKKNHFGNYKPISTTSSKFRINKVKQLNTIENENERLFDRIVFMRGSYSKHKLNGDFINHLERMKRIAKYKEPLNLDSPRVSQTLDSRVKKRDAESLDRQTAVLVKNILQRQTMRKTRIFFLLNSAKRNEREAKRGKEKCE